MCNTFLFLLVFVTLLDRSHKPLTELYQAVDDNTEGAMTKHVSSKLKVAPEYTSAPVLKLIHKPTFDDAVPF